jgi:acetylornithine deacetylase/succinyl-diaminopimelate desuccinylase-like protein
MYMIEFEYLEQTKEGRMNDLFTFLRFPSISAQTNHKDDVIACCNWLDTYLQKIGFKTKIFPTKRHPVLYAEFMISPQLPTVLYYGHYDVQPPEPFELWESKPFDPAIRGGYIYARGAVDDKGQVFAHVKGMEAILKSGRQFPVNIKFIIEGEEEIGSPNLVDFLKENKAMLKADVAVVSDTAQFSNTMPAITMGLRGLAAAELYVYGPNRDVHSGTFGGAIANPVNTLCALVAQLHDKNHKVTIPGFYKDVKSLTKWEKDQFKKLPYKEAAYKKGLGVPALQGEKGFSTFERSWVRPTLDINGITGGYQGEGSKTIIPSMASAKITMRLVPDMDPVKVLSSLEKHLNKLAPKSVKIKLERRGGSRAVAIDPIGPWLGAAAKAIKTGFGKAPVYFKEGGSIPVVGDFKRLLGLDTLLIGFGQNDNRAHSPNECFRVVDFENACRTASALPFEVAAAAKK